MNQIRVFDSLPEDVKQDYVILHGQMVKCIEDLNKKEIDMAVLKKDLNQYTMQISQFLDVQVKY